MDADYRSSLVRRLGAIHSLYYDACETMSVDQVNEVVHQGTLPIAFSLVHQVLIEDATLIAVGGSAPQFNAGWAERIGLGVLDHGKERTVDEMMHQRIEDFDAFRSFQRLVFNATEIHVATIEPSTFSDLLVKAPYPPAIANTFSARVGGETGVTRSDAIESWIYQHALRHMGEIEHARSLVGLGGMTS